MGKAVEEKKDEVVVNEVVVDEQLEVETKETDDKKVGYVKLRVDRAKENTEKNILKDLGVDSLDDAKKKLEDGTKALERVEQLEEKLKTKEYEEEIADKKAVLLKVLDNHNVFDSEALSNYVDLDKLKVDGDSIVDEEIIIEGLKKIKPKFFAEYVTKTDEYIKGDTPKPTTALDKQVAGDTLGAINEYLKEIL